MENTKRRSAFKGTIFVICVIIVFTALCGLIITQDREYPSEEEALNMVLDEFQPQFENSNFSILTYRTIRLYGMDYRRDVKITVLNKEIMQIQTIHAVVDTDGIDYLEVN